jgi:hypothetical protein
LAKSRRRRSFPVPSFELNSKYFKSRNNPVSGET